MAASATATATPATPARGVAAASTFSMRAVETDTHVHIEPVERNKYRLIGRHSNGSPYAISVTKEQQDEIDALCSKLNPTGALDFSIKLQGLIHSVGGVETQVFDDHPNFADYTRLREIAKDAISPNIVWKNVLRDHRTSTTENPSFESTSARLQTLEFGAPSQEKALQNEPGLSFDQKKLRLKRHRIMKRILDAARNAADEVGKAVPPADLHTPVRKKHLADVAAQATDGPMKAVLLFEAMHPVELDGLTLDEQTAALQKKRAQAKAWIEGHQVPKKSFFRSEDVNAEEEIQLAQDMARLGCKTHADYRALVAAPRREGPELFYTRLMEAVMKKDRAEIERLIDSPLALLVIDKLNVRDQHLFREKLKADVLNMVADVDHVDRIFNVKASETEAGLVDRFNAII